MLKENILLTNESEAHLFGLEPNFECCTANFNQAWLKFALSAFIHSEDTVINANFVPSELKTVDKHIKIETNYSFENSFKYKVEAKKTFTFKIRIPSFAENLKVNGEAAEYKF